MAQTLEEAGHDLDDHDHEHHENLAHHFDSYEQQFDAGKLGIWIFLVTEVLFFGGLFCAYALYRNLRPEIFAGCSEFLNTQLGAINTGVLLFSSLTMAWAVRCSQLRQHKMLVGMLAATLSCAAIFLGVKAIEYSHKWSMGLLPAGLYYYDPLHPHHPDAPNYLLYISLPFALILVGVVGWLAVAFLQGDKFKVRVLMPLSVAAACFFVGIGLGMVLESGGVEGHGAVDVDKVAHVHQTGESPELVGAGEQAVEVIAPDDAELTGLELLARDKSNPGAQDALEALATQEEVARGTVLKSEETPMPTASETVPINTPKQAGVFFGIYYCMTGVHAIHILAGMGVMVWLLIRAVQADFNENYFGPVDYVGLYWHLVDLIWIYLFPLLYLIG